jgi:hypothetical protein
VSKAPFVIVPELCAVAVAYKQPSFIADRVLPRVRVNTKEFRYQKFGLGDAFTAPETLIGRKGQPNQVEFGSTEVTASAQRQRDCRLTRARERETNACSSSSKRCGASARAALACHSMAPRGSSRAFARVPSSQRRTQGISSPRATNVERCCATHAVTRGQRRSKAS